MNHAGPKWISINDAAEIFFSFWRIMIESWVRFFATTVHKILKQDGYFKQYVFVSIIHDYFFHIIIFVQYY